MAATVTCVYSINPTGQKTAAQLAVAMAAANVPIPPDFFTLTATALVSDVSVVAGSQAVRTVVFDASAPAFAAQFPFDQSRPFLGLLVGPIQSAVNCTVVETFPVFAP